MAERFNLAQILNNRSRQQSAQIDGQITIQDWLEWKEDIRNRLEESAENFVAIGYRLKQIRDSKMYEKDGFGSVSAWAAAEYRLTKDVVSRFIKINDRFSENGNSMDLKKEFRGYGYGKLQEMLYLTDEEIETVSPEMTTKEIREIRKRREEEAADREENPEEGAHAAAVTEGWMNPPEAPGDDVGEVATTQRKLLDPEETEWSEPKKKEPKPVELPPVDAVYKEKMGETMLREITEGSRRYVLIKKRHKYRVGNTVVLQEHKGGKPTGNEVSFTVTHMTDDSGGLLPGYCILGFAEWKLTWNAPEETEGKNG